MCRNLSGLDDGYLLLEAQNKIGSLMPFEGGGAGCWLACVDPQVHKAVVVAEVATEVGVDDRMTASAQAD